MNGECEHPRFGRVYFPDGRRACAECGAWLKSEPPTPTPDD